MFLQSERQFVVYSVLPNKLVQMDSEATKTLMDADESEDDLNDRISTTSSRSRSKDGRFVNELSQTVHPCPHSDCIKYFTRPSRLQTHLLTHTGDRPYKCLEDGCMKSYSRPAHLKRHTIKSHSSTDPDTPNAILHGVGSDAKTIRCNVCPKLFSNKYSLQKHLKVHQDSLRYSCIECSQSFAKHSLLKSHILEHKSGIEKEAPISCSKCERKFVYASQLQRHVTRHHENRKEYKCEKCEGTFTKWTGLRAHMSSAHAKSSKNSCELCKKVFTGPYAKENLRAHRATHATNRKIYSCPIEPCTRFYYFEKNLKDHIAGYHKGKRFPCLEVGCHARLSSRRKLIQHNRKIHGGSQEPSMCNQEKVRAARKDKGTHKIPMATLLSDVIEESTLQVDRDPSSSGLLQRLESNVNAVALKSDFTLKSVTSTLIENEKPIYPKNQMIKKKRKGMYGKRLFGPGADVPMFSLPSSTRAHLLAKSFLQKEMEIEPISTNPNSALPNSTPPNITNKEASQISTNMKNLDASHKSPASVKSLQSRKVDFSKYVVISTSTYKST